MPSAFKPIAYVRRNRLQAPRVGKRDSGRVKPTSLHDGGGGHGM